MDDVCQKLDEKVLQIFDVLENLYEAQNLLGQSMKNGFLGISRTRCNVGVKCVSSDQIVDANLAANVLVQENDISLKKSVSNSANSEDKTLKEMNKLFDLLSVSHNKPAEPKKVDELKLPKQPSGGTEGPRRRNVGQSTGDGPTNFGVENTQKTEKERETDSFQSDAKGEDGEETERKITNPLSLFGVLVPQSLRSSQKDFSEAVKTCVQIANLKYQLNVLGAEYRQLLNKKKTFSQQE